MEYWTKGFGSEYNPNRKDALDIFKMESYLEDVISVIEETELEKPKIVFTSAKPRKM